MCAGGRIDYRLGHQGLRVRTANRAPCWKGKGLGTTSVSFIAMIALISVSGDPHRPSFGESSLGVRYFARS